MENKNPYLIPAVLLIVGIIVSTLINETAGSLLVSVGLLGVIYVWSNRRRPKPPK